MLSAPEGLRNKDSNDFPFSVLLWSRPFGWDEYVLYLSCPVLDTWLLKGVLCCLFVCFFAIEVLNVVHKTVVKWLFNLIVMDLSVNVNSHRWLVAIVLDGIRPSPKYPNLPLTAYPCPHMGIYRLWLP